MPIQLDDIRRYFRLAFLRICQFFVQFFARLQPDEPDWDIPPGNDPLGQFDDFLRATHAQHVCPRCGHSVYIQHQFGGLRDAHEVARDIGVGDGHRPTGRHLPLETWQDATGTTEDVTETHDGRTEFQRQ